MCWFGENIAEFEKMMQNIITALADTALARLAGMCSSLILVGNKIDLAQTRLVMQEESCAAVCAAGAMYVKTSAGMYSPCWGAYNM